MYRIISTGIVLYYIELKKGMSSLIAELYSMVVGGAVWIVACFKE